jgi:hypothetical protein
MATSQYFNNYGSLPEQRVIDDLIVESIKIMGFDAYYLPNDNDEARDLLFGEDPVKRFGTAFQLEMYLSNTMDYTGEKEFFSKFGLEIKNNVNVIFSRRSFTQRVPTNTFTRPREGDLVYIPFLNGTGELFEIKYVDQSKDFHMLGRRAPYFYELSLEKFKYSQEVIDSGIPDIDNVVTESAYTINLTTAAGNGNNFTIYETVFQGPNANVHFATTTAIVQNWTPTANTLAVTNIKGVFTDNMIVYGETSNARYILVDYDPMYNPLTRERYDNKLIYSSANSIIDFSETNPFGSI